MMSSNGTGVNTAVTGTTGSGVMTMATANTMTNAMARAITTKVIVTEIGARLPGAFGKYLLAGESHLCEKMGITFARNP